MQQVSLHPASVKYIKKGHPWITLDSFSKRFPKDEFLIGKDEKNRPFCIFFHDYTHPEIRGRVLLNIDKVDPKFNFKELLKNRVKNAYKLRSDQKINAQRENYYLIFAEADELPALFVQQIKDIIIIQYFSKFWEKYLVSIMETYLELKTDFNFFVVQNRVSNKNNNLIEVFDKNLKKTSLEKPQFLFKEFNYQMNFNLELNDFGIFTDMSSIRHQILPFFKNDQSYLNLFSYTGAFSLLAHSNKAKKVVSIDLSSKYLDIYTKNLNANNFDSSRDLILNIDVISGLNQLINTHEQFDFIICDPPSFSSDGKKSSSALTNYEKIIPRIIKLIKTNGYLLLFLNTHHISSKKFEESLIKIFTTNTNQIFNKEFKIIKKYGLGEDCPTLHNFPEGNYLKGILIQKFT